MPGAADVVDDRSKVLGMPIRVPRDGGPKRCAALAGPPQGLSAIGVTQPVRLRATVKPA